MLKTYLILAFALITISQAGNLIKLCSANAFAIAFYRLLFALVMMLPFSYSKIFCECRKVGKKTVGLVILMGIIFAFHFITWIKAIQHTKVANAAMCFSLTPIYISVAAHFMFNEKINRKIYVAIATGVVGMFLIGYDDFSLSQTHLMGDVLATIAAILFSLYFLLGKLLRKTIHNNLVLMSIVYFVAALFCFAAMIVMDVPMLGFDVKTYVLFWCLALFPTILGHASMIYVLKDLKASLVSTLTLIEPVMAGIVAFYLFGEQLTSFVLVGYAIISIGIIYLLVPLKKT